MTNDSGSETEPDDRAKVDHLPPRLWQFPWLVVHDPGSDPSVERRQFFLVSVSPFTIGRSATSSLVCASNSVSRHHASLVSRADGWYVQDAESVNGTFVNGTKSLEAKLQTGSRVRVGDVVYKFVADGDRAAKERVLAGELPPDVTPEVSTVAASLAPDAPPATDAPEPRRNSVGEAHDATDVRASERTDYRGADLSGADLSWKSLANANFEGADLSSANLHGARLSGATFAGANLSQANFEGADLSGANLNGATISGADFTVANLERAKMQAARCMVVTMRGANLRWADLSNAQFELTREAMPIRADRDRSEVTMPGAALSRADLSDVNLSGADLRGCNLGGARLTRANLRDANLGNARLRDCDLFGANLRDADLRGADARGAIFDSAWLVATNLEAADLRGATFLATWLLGANLSGTRTSGSDFRDARCSSTTRFPNQLRSLRIAQSRLFNVKPAWTLDRLFGTRYTGRAIGSVDEPCVVLRYVAGLDGTPATRWSTDPRDRLELRSFAKWLERWGTLLAQINFDPRRQLGRPAARMLSINGLDQLRAEHAPVISIAVDTATVVVLRAILTVVVGEQLTDEALSAGAEAIRASVIEALPQLPVEVRVAPHLSDVSASGFYARCIRLVAESSGCGCDVVVVA